MNNTAIRVDAFVLETNFVTPEHVPPQVLEVIDEAVANRLRLSILDNTGGSDPDGGFFARWTLCQPATVGCFHL